MADGDTVAEKIADIAASKAAIAQAISAKGVAVPSGAKLADLAPWRGRSFDPWSDSFPEKHLHDTTWSGLQCKPFLSSPRPLAHDHAQGRGRGRRRVGGRPCAGGLTWRRGLW